MRIARAQQDLLETLYNQVNVLRHELTERVSRLDTRLTTVEPALQLGQRNREGLQGLQQEVRKLSGA